MRLSNAFLLSGFLTIPGSCFALFTGDDDTERGFLPLSSMRYKRAAGPPHVARQERRCGTGKRTCKLSSNMKRSGEILMRGISKALISVPSVMIHVAIRINIAFSTRVGTRSVADKAVHATPLAMRTRFTAIPQQQKVLVAQGLANLPNMSARG